MDFIDNSGVGSLIKNEQINFVGVAITPWHAHGIDCAIKYLQDNGIEVKGVVIISLAVKQGKITHLLTEDNFVNTCCKYYKREAIFDSSLMHILETLKDNYLATKVYNNQNPNGRPLYIATAWHPNIDLLMSLRNHLGEGYNFKMMVVEEGLSTYFPQVKSWKHIWSTTKTSKKGISLVMSVLLRQFSLWLIARFENNTQWTNLNLLLEQDKELHPNPLATKYYRKILTEFCSKNVQQYAISDFNGCIIICTMAYMHSEIENDSDVTSLTAVVKALQQAGHTVYIKPHPRDVDYRQRYAPLCCQFIEIPYSVETLMVKFPYIKAIISFSSTSLVTAKMLFGINAISILNIIEQEKYGDYIKDEMKSFVACFSNLVDIPKDIDEMVKILS